MGDIFGKVALGNFNTFSKTASKNLFNKGTAVAGYYVNYTNGNLSASASYYASDYIPVRPNSPYTRKVSTHIAYYDANKTYISGAASSGLRITTPANCYYIRMSITVAGINSEELEYGWFIDATTYADYGMITKSFEVNPTLSEIIPQLPVKIYALVGCEVNIYFANLIKPPRSLNDFQFDVECGKGVQQSERWTYTPVVGDIGNVDIVVAIYYKDTLIAKLHSTIVVTAAGAGTNLTPKVLMIGDSTLSNDIMIGELDTLFDADSVMHPTFVGTRGALSGIKHEGISGWTVNNFYTSDITFVFGGSFNFAQYLSTNSVDTPDVVIFNLGINDVFALTTDATVDAKIAEMKTQLDAMITNIKVSNANAKFGICLTIPPAATQDAFGDDYSAGQNRDRYRRNNAKLVSALIEYYSAKESSKIYAIPINVNIDTVYNFPSASVAVNSRNATTVVRQNNGVHPDSSGYYQIADSMYYFMKSVV